MTEMKEENKNYTGKPKMSRGGRYRTKPVTPKEKIKYFIDYYLLYVVIGVIAVVLLGSLVKTIFFNHTETVLEAVFVSYQQPDTDSISQSLREYLEIEDEDQEISVSMLTPDSYQSSMALTAWVSAKSVDLLIMDPDSFVSYTEYGFCQKLDDFLDADVMEELKPYLVESKLAKTNDTGELVGYTDEGVYGIQISYDSKTGTFTRGGEELILAVTINTEHAETVKKAIPYFLNK